MNKPIISYVHLMVSWSHGISFHSTPGIFDPIFVIMSVFLAQAIRCRTTKFSDSFNFFFSKPV